MIAFPANPSVNDTYTASGRTWRWTGVVWQLQPRTLTSADITDFAAAVGAAAPPTTDASLLTSGTLADARLSAAVTASLAKADTASQPGHGHEVSDIDGLQSALDGKQPAGSYATLVNGTVPADQLPSYVDDVIEAADFASLPATGESGKIYVTLDTRKTYRWSGSVYVEISPSEVTSVAGKTGAVTLDKSDVGLGNVDNTSDLDKPISTATQTALDAKFDRQVALTGIQINGSTAPSSPSGGKGGQTIPASRNALQNVEIFNLSSSNFAEVVLAKATEGSETNDLLKVQLSSGSSTKVKVSYYKYGFFSGSLGYQSTPTTLVDLAPGQSANFVQSGANWSLVVPQTIYSDTAPSHVAGLEWVDTTDLRSYRSYDNLWVEIDRA